MQQYEADRAVVKALVTDESVPLHMRLQVGASIYKWVLLLMVRYMELLLPVVPVFALGLNDAPKCMFGSMCVHGCMPIPLT